MNLDQQLEFLRWQEAVQRDCEEANLPVQLRPYNDGKSYDWVPAITPIDRDHDKAIHAHFHQALVRHDALRPRRVQPSLKLQMMLDGTWPLEDGECGGQVE